MAMAFTVLVLLSAAFAGPWMVQGTVSPGGMLYPRASESRQLQDLDGMWWFRADMSLDKTQGMDQKWFSQSLKKTGPVIPMPVPSSYNDITTSAAIRDFVGWVWYETEAYVSSDWNTKRVVLRFGSAHYYAMVWINGKMAMEHDGGHLPFEAEVNDLLTFGGANRITVAVNNTLSPHTIPPGYIQFKSGSGYPPNYSRLVGQFDFFNYAGIHRHVTLYTTPKTYVDDITVKTSVEGADGMVSYTVMAGGSAKGAATTVEVWDAADKMVSQATGSTGTVKIANVNLWWPHTMMKQDQAYMYTLKVTVKSSANTDMDVYRLPFGVRTIQVTKTQILVNNKPFYCQGMGKHEDSDIRGKGLDYALIARDFNMLKWLGASCFRTSHYPYAEEIMDQADQQGVMVIDECPAVGLKTDENFSNKTLMHHLDTLTELVRRDKNRPSVLMWSVANEPASDKSVADYYFKTAIGHVKSLDSTRPVTFVSASDYHGDKAAKYTDVQCINRYFGWYSDTGHPEVIHYQLSVDLENWYKVMQKPLIISEYGADTVSGLHTLPSFIFTEDYQVEFMEQYFNVFDVYRKKWLSGEMIWNFADFMTDQAVNRVVGNKKGVLTRQRQPKAAGHVLRRRYWSLVNETVPYRNIPY